MPSVVPNYDEIKVTIQDELRNAGFTNFSESSAIGIIVNVVAAFVADIYVKMQQYENSKKLSTAVGDNLDEIGESYGVRRLPAKEATTIGAGQAVMFTNTSEIADITVPEHTRIWSPLDYNIAYYTTNVVVVPKGGGEQYVDVIAAGTGDRYNVGPESLTQHNVGDPALLVTNIISIANGNSVETDDNYRYRISNAVLARAGFNEAAIRMKLIEIPGVRDAEIHNCARGAGTVDIVIIPTARRATKELLDLCQQVAGEVVAPGISAKVKAPIERPVDLTITAKVAAAGNATLIRSLVSAAARSYIDNLAIGDVHGSGDIIYNELLSRLMNVHQDVADVALQLRIDNRQAIPNVNQRAKPGERFYLQSIRVV